MQYICRNRAPQGRLPDKTPASIAAPDGDGLIGDPRVRRYIEGMTAAVFPTPDHDHDRCLSEAIAHAERVCRTRAQRLTPLRRQVLEALLASHQPLGAYDIIERVTVSGGRPAPITIYRVLDFLRENGLVHRIESRNAFIACGHNHEAGDLVVFLICEQCGAVGEAPAKMVAEALKGAAGAAGFMPKASVIEITGICGHCREHAAS